MKQYPYNFGLSQEDALSEFKATDLASGRALCVASGGEVPLNLLALGAKEVIAYDNNEGQIALCHLKRIASQKLGSWKAARFLGYCHQSSKTRVELYNTKLRDALPKEIRIWWDNHRETLSRGALWQGKFEKFLKWLSLIARLIISRRKFEKLFTLSSKEERRAYFEKHICNRRLRLLFQFFFNEKRYGDNALPAIALRHNNLTLSDAFMECFRTMCIATPPKSNYYLQLLLLGEIKFEEALPEYLHPQYREQFLESAGSVEFILGDFSELHSSDREFDAIILSNICDWMERETYEQVLTEMAKLTAPGGHIFWRSIYSKFSADECHIPSFEPSSQEQMQTLEVEDRFPFYGFYSLKNCQ